MTMESEVPQTSGGNVPTTSERWRALFDELTQAHDADLLEWRRPLPTMLLLSRLGRELRGVHWASLPGGGGVEITGASSGVEVGLQLEIRDGAFLYVCEPASLACILNPKSFDLAYFDLDLCRISGGTGQRVRETRRGVIRTTDFAEITADYTLLRRGRVIICLKGSVLHDVLREDSQGKLNLMTREAFRRFVEGDVTERLKSSNEDVDDQAVAAMEWLTRKTDG